MTAYALAGLAIWNGLVFAAYGLDKRRAQQGQWRIPERTLLLMTLGLGGCGALLAGRLFHHKTKKWYFVSSWYLGSLLVLAAIYLIWSKL